MIIAAFVFDFLCPELILSERPSIFSSDFFAISVVLIV